MPATAFSFITLSVLLCLLSFAPRAQPFIHFEPVKTSHNTPTMTRFGTLAIDDRGHICASVKSQGLHCYDGIHLTTVYNDYVASITRNNDQVLGATKQKVFFLLNGEIRFLSEHRQPVLEQEERIVQVLPDQYSELLILTNRGVHRLYTDLTEKIYHSDSENFHFTSSDTEEESVWISSNEGLYLYNTINQEKQIFFKDAHVYEVTEDFYLTNKGIYRRDNNELILEGIFFRSLRLNNNDWLVAGIEGICRIENLERTNCSLLSSNALEQHIAAFSFLADPHGNVFAATSNGLYVSQPKFYQNFTQRHGLLSNRVSSLLAMDDVQYVGTSKGLNRLDMKTGEISAVSGTEDMAITSIERVDDTLWLGVSGEGVLTLEVSNQQLTKIIDADDRIFSITFVEDFIYLAIQNQGLFKYDQKGNVIVSRQQKHFRDIRHIQMCGDYLFVGTMSDGIIKVNSELVIEDLSDSKSLHTFTCDDEKIIAGSRAGEQQTLDLNLHNQNTYAHQNAIFNILSYNTSFLVHNAKGLYFADTAHFFDMPVTAFINVANIQNEVLYFGSNQGLFRVNLRAAETFEAAAPIMNLTLNRIDGGQLLHLRTENLVKSSDYQWFLSYDNQTFALMPDNDVFIPQHEKKTSVFIYFKNSMGWVSPVKEVTLPRNATKFLLMDIPLFYILIAIMVLTLLLGIIQYRKSFILSDKNDLAKFKGLESSIYQVRSLYSDEDVKELDIDQVRAKAQRIDNEPITDYHEARVAQLNQLLREQQRYLQGKEISAAINVSEHQVRFSLRSVFGNGSIKAYTPIYLDMIKQENSYDTT
ncbi:MAG: hypothetical protein AAGB12_12905 [Pseudomonadota bacterium]